MNDPILHVIEVEQALLGAILNDARAFDAAEQFITASDFFEPSHQFLFDRFAEERRAGSSITLQLVRVWLGDLGKTDIAGLTLDQYVARLASAATGITHAADYAKQITETANQRRLMEVAHTIRDNVTELRKSRDVASAAIDALDAIAASGGASSTGRASLYDAAQEAFTSLSDRLAHPGSLRGASFGISQILDARLGGLIPGNLYIKAGRPGMGKTALAVDSAYKSARQGQPALFFSLEMTRQQLANRVIASACYRGVLDNVPYADVEKGSIRDRQVERYVDAYREFSDIPLIIEDEGGLSVGQIAARARRHKQRLADKGLKLRSVWIDYLGLIKASQRYAGNRVNEVSEISAALKALAKELDVAVVALCQLNRAVEGRDNKRPTLSDLRDSGSIEQDADVVIFAFRESYYLEQPQTEPAREQDRITKLGAFINRIELNLAKNRHGPTGVLELFCDMPCNFFADLGRPA